ncbi:MAG: hypothetical protein KC766_14000 [Myxococcales bacterium]|nr:hypothetical protein [Myxococcales bacterium]
MNTRAAVSGLLVCCAALLACKKVKVPAPWEPYVPTEGLSNAIPMSTYGSQPPQIRLFYKRSKVDVNELKSGFETRFQGMGLEKIWECTDIPDKPAAGFAKAPQQYVDYSVNPLTPETWNAQVAKTDKITRIGLPQKRQCVWLPAAAKVCGSVPTSSECHISLQAH